MAVANNVPFSSFRIQDQQLSVSVTLPAAGNTATLGSNGIALFAQGINGNFISMGSAFPVTGRFLVQIAATAANSNGGANVNIYVQQTNANADGTANVVNWTNVPYLAHPVMQLTDANNVSTAANTINFFLPPDVLSQPGTYIRVACNGETNTGNASNGTATLRLLF